MIDYKILWRTLDTTEPSIQSLLAPHGWKTPTPDIRERAFAKLAANFIQTEVLRYVVIDGLEATFPVPAEELGKLLMLVQKGKISRRMAKDVFEVMRETGRTAADIVAERGLAQVSDTGAIEAEVRKVLAASEKQVAQYKAGNEKMLGFFVGQVMKAMKGSGNPALVNDVLKRCLSEEV